MSAGVQNRFSIVMRNSTSKDDFFDGFVADLKPFVDVVPKHKSPFLLIIPVGRFGFYDVANVSSVF